MTALELFATLEQVTHHAEENSVTHCCILINYIFEQWICDSNVQQIKCLPCFLDDFRSVGVLSQQRLMIYCICSKKECIFPKHPAHQSLSRLVLRSESGDWCQTELLVNPGSYISLLIGTNTGRGSYNVFLEGEESSLFKLEQAGWRQTQSHLLNHHHF